MHPLEALRLNPFVLAPMAGITDCAFRDFMKSLGCGIVVTELVSAHGIEYRSARTLSLMRFSEKQKPIGIQIFGEEPEVMARAARVVEDAGADFVDLNFGCPVPKVVKKGAGSALLKDLVQLAKVLSAVKKAVHIPVTIKIRTGWCENSRNARDVVHVAFNEGILWVAIHGRTRSAGYSGHADWTYISEVKAQSPLPIIGNGDILSAAQGLDLLKTSSCDGVMIGRGALKNPYIFLECLSLYTGQQLQINRDFTRLFLKLRDNLEEHCDDRITQLQLRKFASWFSTGFPGSGQFRKNLFQTHSTDDIMLIAKEYFSAIQSFEQADTSSEPFLMGGHG